ncbi:MAG: tRNA-dihydrouridine synthase, partial [Megasphaera lornae]
ERYTQILAHLEALVAYKGEYIGIREMRAHASWYTRGLYGSAALRERINRTVSVAEFRAVVEEMRRHAAGD